jgi:ribosomal protein S6--L-glutamate ligase
VAVNGVCIKFEVVVMTEEKKYSLVIIGSRAYKKSTVNALLAEAKNQFKSVLFVPINKIEIQTSEGKIGVFYKGKNLLGFDCIYPRISSKDMLLGEPLMRIIQDCNAYCPLNLEAFQITNHKFYTTQRLSNARIPSVKSTLFISPKRADFAAHETGYPFVMKLISGFAGKGVVLINNKEQMDSILEAIHLFEEFISTQQFVKGKKSDVRCYVIGHYVIAVKRECKKGEWRANVSRGGKAVLINPNQEMLDTAKSAAKELGMGICSVDLMRHKKRWAVIEVNFMPGPFKKFLGNMVVEQWIRFLHEKTVQKNQAK